MPCTLINRLVLCWAVIGTSVSAWAISPADDAAAIEFFERKVRPLLVEHCYACHSSQAKIIHGGLRLDSADAFARGGDSGPLVDHGNPRESWLLEVLRHTGDVQMPPDGKLPADDLADIEQWLAGGAVWPVAAHAPTEQSRQGPIDWEQARQFWSFRPLRRQPLPDVRQADWGQTRVDRFVLAAMEANGLVPAPPATREVLIRRLYLDLLGLPPTPEQVAEYVEDLTVDPHGRMVDRLMQSPHYGERWGRMWLDLARYTDATASWLEAAGEPHLYRDWIVAAWNDAMPYDEFIQRQLATDLMPHTGPSDLPALGLVSLSPTYWKELKLPCEIINTIVADEWEERVGAISQTFLGLTVACARCHDHKFDPISSADYYALAGVFASCRQTELPTIDPQHYAPVAQAKQQIAQLEAELAKLKKDKSAAPEQMELLTTQIQKLKKTPLLDTPMASVVTEESLYVERAGATPQDGTLLAYRPGPRDLPLYVRGDPNRPGPLVPRRFLQLFASTQDAAAPAAFRQGSGRLELAQAITGEAAALTARVMVNRLWLALFGRGLVSTPSNFGSQGSPPSHPELLDDLAYRLIESGWSLQTIQRELLLSATYRQSSEYRPQQAELDPQNVWLSRMNRRRLDFECWRDGMLLATGQLDARLGGLALELDAADNHRRTLYANIHRHEMSTTLLIHDFPDPNQHSPARTTTVSPLQGLYALNGPLLGQQAEKLSERLHREQPVAKQADREPNAEALAAAEQARIARAYQLLFGRRPSDHEMELGMQFLTSSTASPREQRWQQYAHVLLAANELMFVD